MKVIILFFIAFSFFSFADNSKKNHIAELLVNDEVNMFLKGNDSLFNKAIKSFTVSELIKDNKNNQKENTNDRIIRIKTVISKIKTQGNEHTIWEAHGINNDEIVYLFINPNHTNINQNETVDMICVEAGQYVAYPVLKNCVSIEKYANKLKKVNIKYLTKTDNEHGNTIYLLDVFYNALFHLYINDDQIKQLIDYGDIKLIKNENISNKISRYIDDIINNYSEEDIKNMKLAIIPSP